MRTLIQTLQDHDPGYLHVVAELWGIDLPAEAGAEQLSQAMLEAAPDLALPESAQRALEHLQRAGGRLSWEELNRRYGPLREMGAGRRDRLKPWRDPTSALEMLWYRGVIGRAFADSAAGPLEYGFIPRDLRPRLPQPKPLPEAPPGTPAQEPRDFSPASSLAVDDATTVLAELRRNPRADRVDPIQPFLLQAESSALLLELLVDLPKQPERLKEFLTRSRGDSLAWLQRAWLKSAKWNDLAQLGTLQVAAEDWPNDPIAGRAAALQLISQIPRSRWWSIANFVTAVQQRAPNYLRGPGGFDSWYLQRASDGQFLTGFEHWGAVEGAYLRYLLCGPMHWLGAVDLSADRERMRLAETAAPLLDGRQAAEIDEATGSTAVHADGEIRVGRHVDRALRYQIARFARWEQAAPGGYTYRLSAEALKGAEAQGLTAAHADRVLTEATGGELPAGVARALERWGKHGVEVSLLRELVLQVKDPQILEQLSEHRSTRRLIKARLGPDRAVVLESDWEQLCAAALGLGLLIQEPKRVRSA